MSSRYSMTLSGACPPERERLTARQGARSRLERTPQRIIDGHCHVASLDYIPRSFIEGVVDNIASGLTAQGVRFSRAKIFELYIGKMQDPYCDALAAEMAESGIERSVLLLPDFTY